MARTDYLDDPAAPKANSVIPAVSVVVPDDQGRILLIRRTDNNYWSIPGGGIEPGESVRQAASREVMEETGINCDVTGLVGIYSNPHHVAAYDDGEVRQEFLYLPHRAYRERLAPDKQRIIRGEIRSRRRYRQLWHPPIDTDAHWSLSGGPRRSLHQLTCAAAIRTSVRSQHPARSDRPSSTARVTSWSGP